MLWGCVRLTLAEGILTKHPKPHGQKKGKTHLQAPHSNPPPRDCEGRAPSASLLGACGPETLVFGAQGPWRPSHGAKPRCAYRLVVPRLGLRGTFGLALGRHLACLLPSPYSRTEPRKRSTRGNLPRGNPVETIRGQNRYVCSRKYLHRPQGQPPSLNFRGPGICSVAIGNFMLAAAGSL